MKRDSSNTAPTKIGIVGLGLIGGSIAKRLGPSSVVGAFDTNLETLRSAEAEGFKTYSSIRELAENVEIIFVATPMPEMSDVFDQIDRASNASELLVSDVGSVKSTTRRLVFSKKRSWKFIGGHPMAGTESFGFSAASSDLLRGARWVLCIEEDTDFNSFLKLVEIITRDIGARVVPLESSVHDLAVANISHLPYVVSSALSQMVDSSPSHNLFYQLAAGSFRDATRVSGTPPTLSRDMCYQNRDSLIPVVREYIQLLESLYQDLQLSVNTGVSTFFEKGNHARNRYLSANDDSSVLIVNLGENEEILKMKVIELGCQGGTITKALDLENQKALEFLVPHQSNL